MPDPRLYDNPSDVDNDAGEILVSGPDGIASRSRRSRLPKPGVD